MTFSIDRRLPLLLAAAGVAAVPGLASQVALAQSAPVVSQPVVQAIPGSDTLTLNAALTRLGRNPRDVEALVDAGNAALAMGDVDAATGFYRRADQVAPGNPRVKAGLAGAMVRNGDPFGALPLFDEAERAGALDDALAADRGLAYDLVGDSVSAQRFYRQALARGSNDEVVRRLALSQAIAGDRKASESTLTPLLQRQDKAAWRTRAFALAILGQPDEAIAISKTVLPGALAEGIAPYLRYMPRLTHAQQAAAANFGSFPLPSEIGRDDPRVAQYAPAGTRRPALAAADATQASRNETVGRNKRTRGDRKAAVQVAAATVPSSPPASASPTRATPTRVSRNAARAARESRVAPPDPMPTRQAAPASTPAAPAAVAASRTPAPPLAAATPAAIPATAGPTPTQALVASPSPSVPPAAAPIAARGFDLGLLPSGTASMSGPVTPSSSSPAADALAAATPGRPGELPPVAARPPALPAPSPAAVPSRPAATPSAPVRAARPSLADAFSEFSRPPADVTPAAGAVDIRRIRPARPKAEQPAKPPPPSHPSRIWVQVATGRDKAALGFDWRRLIRKAPEVFRGKRGQVSDWGQTNRLLTGPFESTAAANAFVAQLRRADIDGSFVWTSPAGQVVDALSARDEPAPTPTPAPKPTTRKRRN